MEQAHESLKHLFQQEFSKMVAVISRLFGLQHIALAEDIVSDTFLLAAETWGTKGMPPNPTAWLYAVGKQKTLYLLRRNKILEQKVIPAVKSGSELQEEDPLPDFSQQNIRDSQLQMMFAICDPAIASEAQIGLALRILCGFGIDEIAEAFLTSKETINKRLFRAKEKLRAAQIRMELPPEHQLDDRLDNVLHIIYLLFSEGYYSKTQDAILQKDLCLEAMRLGLMLTAYERTDRPKTNALLALMCFHASRFDARQAGGHAHVLYDDQDDKLWDQALIREGWHYLQRSMQGNELSSYHLEAGIASWHCTKEDTPEKWNDILRLYDQLLVINYSPAVALNRIFALYKAQGIQAALQEMELLKPVQNNYYFMLLGELYETIDATRARAGFQKAWELAATETEKKGIEARIKRIK